MSTFPKRAILPCEIKSREFDSKLLLACFLAERGWTTIVGSRNDIHMKLHTFPRSVYLGKDVRFSSATIVTMLRLLGHRFVAMDEEAQFFLSRERYRKARVDEKVLSQAEALFAWGSENALAWEESPGYRGQPIHQTGNGRIDLLRPELRGLYAERTAELKQRYGNFILVNTNFGAINHFFGNLSVSAKEGDKQPVTRAYDNGYILHRQKVLSEFQKMLPNLAKRFPNSKIVLRPHPSENTESWQQQLHQFDTVEVNNKGSVIPWILASQLLLHNGCTTGFEALALDVFPVAYQPVKSEIFDLHLPNELSCSVENEDELFNIVSDVLSNKRNVSQLRTSARLDLLQKNFAALEGPLASERLAAQMDEHVGFEAASSGNSVQRTIGAIYSVGRAMLKHVNSKVPGHKSNRAYTRHRFPDTSLEEVRKQIRRYNQALTKFENFNVIELMPNVFEIAPA